MQLDLGNDNFELERKKNFDLRKQEKNTQEVAQFTEWQFRKRRCELNQTLEIIVRIKFSNFHINEPNNNEFGSYGLEIVGKKNIENVIDNSTSLTRSMRYMN